MKPRILLVGYNGANNTGAEAKLLVIINEIRSVLGPDACITVPSLNEVNLRRYLQEGPNLKIRVSSNSNPAGEQPNNQSSITGMI